jgi:putative endonuclease
MIYLYAISSVSFNWIYVGQTENVMRRFHEHNDGHEKTTRRYAPFMLIFSMECVDRTEARKYEKFYKTGQGKNRLRELKLRQGL